MEGTFKIQRGKKPQHMSLLHREWEIWFRSVDDIIFSSIRVTFEVKTTFLHLQRLYLQTVVLFLERASQQGKIKDKLYKTLFCGINCRKKKELFPSLLVKAAVRASLLNAQVTHNPPAARRQLAPSSLEKLSAPNRCPAIVCRFKSNSGPTSCHPSPLKQLLLQPLSKQLHSHFPPKRPNMTFTLLFECFSPLSFFIYLTGRSEGRKWNLFLVYYESAASLLTAENRSKSFESHTIISINTSEVHQSATLILYLYKVRIMELIFSVMSCTIRLPSLPKRSHKYSLD